MNLYVCLEALLGIINACLPLMKPVFRKLRSSKVSSLFSSFTSGSIAIFIRISLLGRSWRSHPTKRDPTNRQPLPKENTPWSPKDASSNGMPTGMQQSPSPKYMDASPIYPKSTFTPIKIPAPPFSSKSRAYSPTVRQQQEVDAKPGINVEKSWEVDVERDGSVESDQEGLVTNTKRWGLL